jgi:FkbH-like protein
MIQNFIAKARASLDRDRHLPLLERLHKSKTYLVSAATARVYLRHCTRVGARARTIGQPLIRNDGVIEIGDDLVINSTYSPVELAALDGGTIRLGDRVHINYGTSVTSSGEVTLGDDVSIGPYTIIGEPFGSEMDRANIEIGSGVWLAARVTVLHGATIGTGSVITAGSIVAGIVPPGVVAGGIPARTMRQIEQSEAVPARTRIAGVRRKADVASAQPELSQALTGVVLADFTIGTLARQLQDPEEQPSMIVADAPYCQTAQMLLSEARSGASDFLIVWTRPELVSPGFQQLLSFGTTSAAELRSDVNAFADLIARAAEKYRFALVPTWTLPFNSRGRGMTDSRPGGLHWGLTIMNQCLMDRLGESKTAFVLNADRWLAEGTRASAKAWYLGKIPFHADVFVEAARDIKAAARGLSGAARKLLILDLDDTLWGGIVGDVGWQNLQLGGHDGVGEAYVDFQRSIKALKRRGIILGLVSKNTEAVALEALRSHPEMILRPEDFAGWRINWGDKAQNVSDLAAELNLGLQSVVFIDDNPVERARVREALPEVFVPEWPTDKLLYPSELLSLRCFDAPTLTQEDFQRAEMYAAERDRNAIREQVGSAEEWLESLQMVVKVEPLGAANAARTVQLLNKTNQMNLTTRRLTESELSTWNNSPGRAVLTISVADKYGSSGLTGILGVEEVGQTCTIVDFVLSCRVMGRRVEETMLHIAVEWARARGLKTVVATYVPTKKNQPCHDFWLKSGFQADATGREFEFDAGGPYPLPACISLQWDVPAGAWT